MAHVIFSNSFCNVGHKVISNLIKNDPYNRCTKEQVSEAMNAELNLLAEGGATVTPALVNIAVQCGAFNNKNVIYWTYRGCHGGICEAATEPVAEPVAKQPKRGRKACVVEVASEDGQTVDVPTVAEPNIVEVVMTTSIDANPTVQLNA